MTQLGAPRRRCGLRGALARLAWHTVRDLMATAVEEPSLRPGMVSVRGDKGQGDTMHNASPRTVVNVPQAIDYPQVEYGVPESRSDRRRIKGELAGPLKARRWPWGPARVTPRRVARLRPAGRRAKEPSS